MLPRRLRAVRLSLRVVACAGAVVAGVDCSVLRSDNAAWTPTDSSLADRGAHVSRRFALERRFQIAVQVNNVFLPSNRLALARAEAALARLPGVRSVQGPAGLLAIATDAEGRLGASAPLFAVAPALGNALERQVANLRHAVVRRPDAMGWFVSRDGTDLRFIIEADRIDSLRPQVSAALLASGLTLLDGDAGTFLEMPLLPSPARDSTSYSPGWLLVVVLALASLFGAPAIRATQPMRTRALLAALVAGLSTASLGVFAPVVPLRRFSLMAGLAVFVWLSILVILLRKRSAPPANGAPPRVRVPSGLMGIPCAALVILLLAAWPRLRLETRVWQPSSLFFISVRGALDQPVVLREVRRLTDFVRERPGVIDAWSIADAVSAQRVRQDHTGIPEDAPTLAALLTRLDADSAARLEIDAEHRETLVVVRWDDAAGVDRIDLVRRIERYIADEQRSTLARVDLAKAATPVVARGFARGILVADENTRVMRACARFGRNVDDAAVASTERLMRQAALAPAMDLPRLRAELEGVLRQFLEECAAARRVGTPQPGEGGASASFLSAGPFPRPLVDAVTAEPWESDPSDLARALSGVGLGKSLESFVRPRLPELHARLAGARRRHAGRLLVKEVLAELDLPVDGALSEQVRDATLEATGSVVGVPVSAPTDTTFSLDSFIVGGAAQDWALSRAWLPRLWLGIAASGLLLAVVLLLTGGVAALGWWPVGLGPIAAALAVPAIGGVSIGIGSLVVAAGALAGGAALAVMFAPAWEDA